MLIWISGLATGQLIAMYSKNFLAWMLAGLPGCVVFTPLMILRDSIIKDEANKEH
jgi:hypothetical protein